MMPTSDSCRPSDRHGSSGFSLLEMLVVLALVSIMVALVAPRLAGTVRAIATSGERSEVVRQIERLPLLARGTGRAIVVDADGVLATEGLAFPEGWEVSVSEPFRVAANGICHPARVRVEGGGVMEEWTVAAPDCRVVQGP